MQGEPLVGGVIRYCSLSGVLKPRSNSWNGGPDHLKGLIAQKRDTESSEPV